MDGWMFVRTALAPLASYRTHSSIDSENCKLDMKLETPKSS